MNIPRHWHRAKRGEFFCWGWSSENDAAARAMAEARVAEVERRNEAGELRDRGQHYYFDRPVREPVLREFHATDGSESALVTRNSYGCLVLNSAQALFVDVDLPEQKQQPAGGGWLLGRLFGKKEAPAPAVDPVADTIGRAQAWSTSRPGWGWRIYRTKAGLRLLATHAQFSPDAPEVAAAFDALGADPLYRKLCASQRCFRARLTPKPWRCGHVSCSTRWPWTSARAESDFNKWQEVYTESCKSHATCDVVTEAGTPGMHPDLAPVIEFHDAVTRCGSGLPLA